MKSQIKSEIKSIKIGQSDIEISSIIMGTSQAGKTHWVGIEDGETIAAVHAAMDAGITAFDTAEQYGEGWSETVLGRALGSRRKDVAILSKVFPTHLKYEQVLSSCEQSLRNLNTDYLDLYQIHWPSGAWKSEVVPIEETLEALLHLKAEGKIRAIGVSNFSLNQLKEVQAIGQVDAIQLPYSLFWRFIENEISAYCREHRITVLAYAPLSQGFLTGKFRAGHTFERGDHRFVNKLFSSEVYPSVVSAVERLQEVADRKGITLAQLALGWVVHHTNTGAVVGARNAAQITNSALGGRMSLSEEEVQDLAAIAWPVAEKFIDSPLIWNLPVS